MEFVKWASIPRLSKESMTITEKIDGTNACIRIRLLDLSGESNYNDSLCTVSVDDVTYAIWVQSRTRFLTPGKENDNFGFAKWVHDNAAELVSTLGPGDHYGEWWGSKIQRGYGLKERRFSLFNAPRWLETLHPTETRTVPGLHIVPLLYKGPFDGALITQYRELLRLGSRAVDHEFKAEGLVVYLREVNSSYKVLLENDDIHKWEVKK